MLVHRVVGHQRLVSLEAAQILGEIYRAPRLDHLGDILTAP